MLFKSGLFYHNPKVQSAWGPVDATDSFVVHIDQMPMELLICHSSAAYDRVGTFFVGAEPFNPHEDHTVHNTLPSRALDKLNIKIYDKFGVDASVSNPFYMKIRM